MIGQAIFMAVCSGGVVFLVYVLVAFWREDRSRLARHRRLASGSKAVVVQLPPGPIFTAASIRPAGIPESAPFTIISNLNRPAAAFYVEQRETSAADLEVRKDRA